MKFKTHIDHLKRLNVHYIFIPASVVKKLGKISVRVLCQVNKNKAFQCGPVALGEGNAYITLSAARMKAFQVKKGDTVAIDLELDESEFGMEMPETLQELLTQDGEGKRRFDLLADGKKRYIINYVATVKSADKQIERAILLIENLKKTKEGKETFRAMLGLPEKK